MDDNYYIITQEEADKLRDIMRAMYGGSDRERDYAAKLDHLYRTMTDCPAKRGDMV